MQDITTSQFQSEVLDFSLPVLVDFWAEWCAPCKRMQPSLEELAAEWHGRAKIAKVNIDVNPGLGLAYNIQSVPTVIIFLGGEPRETFMGFTSKAKLGQALEGLMK